MSEPLGNWIFTLAVSAGLLPAQGADFASRRAPVPPMDVICHARFDEAAAGVFHGVGVVTEIDAGTGALTLDHEDIIGLMPSMVMMYRVATPVISRALKVGDRIAFDLDGKSYTILGAKVISP